MTKDSGKTSFHQHCPSLPQLIPPRLRYFSNKITSVHSKSLDIPNLPDTPRECLQLPIYLRDLRLPGVQRSSNKISKIKRRLIIKFNFHLIAKNFSARLYMYSYGINALRCPQSPVEYVPSQKALK